MPSRIIKLVTISFLLVLLSGCATLVSKPPKVVLMPEERIFTIPGGQEIKVWLDHKEIAMTFPEDMKLVSPTVLVRQEEKLNNVLLDKIKTNAKNKTTLGIIGSILAIFGGLIGIIFRKNLWPKITFKAGAEVK